MKRTLFSLLLVLLSALSLQAQETYLFAEKDTCQLYLDIHRPAAGAQTTFQGLPKPTILYVFGGGFIMGSRCDAVSGKWYKTLNNEGYTVVAIDYRLGMKGHKMGKGLSSQIKAMDKFVMAQQMGVEDVFSAISFLAAHPELNIPMDNIVISGSSAGAIISLASAYAIANGQTAGLPEGFRFKGVMSFAGGIISKTGAPKFLSAPCPLLLFHGNADNAVAYDHYGALGMGVWGSSFIADQLKKQGWNYSIWRFNGRKHDVAAYMDVLWPREKEFLEKTVMQAIPCTVDAFVDDPSLPVWEAWGDISVEGIYK